MICLSSSDSVVVRVGSTSVSRRIAAVTVPAARSFGSRRVPSRLRRNIAGDADQDGTVGGWRLDAENLRNVLARVESHLVSWYADSGDDPEKQLELVPGAVEEAELFSS
jgi:hypothetical protein